MYRLFGIFAILTLLCISSTSGHDINYQFTSISVAEGLSQSTAQSILLDKKGKLWIGTKVLRTVTLPNIGYKEL